MADFDQRETPELIRALSPALYGDRDVFAREKQAIFARTWRLVGHENMLASAGDFITDDFAGTSIMLVRGADEEIRAFYNICPHRAGPLATEFTGNCGHELTCKYHGWRFMLDGRLRAARDFGNAAGFDPRDFGLKPVRLEQWRRFLFVVMDEDAAPLAALMAPIEEAWPETAIQPFALRRSHEIACDWKAYVENYLEGYHVPTLHPTLDAEIVSEDYQVEMHDQVAVHTAPSKGEDAVYTGFWGWVFPLLGINVYQHGVMMERISPVGPDRTRLDYLYFFDPARRDELEAMLKLSDAVTAEDVWICERVQKNLTSGVYEPGPLSPRHEGAVRWFQDQIRSRLELDG
ncbi:aromatic ring-hydroxylating dioxygenase subunit alpha [Parvularcula sp. IMCC14364]|uniref:aromatic ring-hydroxylating oxygenase subunit alpha n=1 Tax=Parvularcula sp. IMCC14364 TaxID=3067902 RepID=UPI002740C253|nr:SRPBCC family protein [Parvularcula sp. IMCC14364]